MKFTLILVRHGETAHNKESIIQGHLDVPLSSNGIHQAKQLGRKFKLGNQAWKEVWSSDLKRAWQTANLIINTDSAEEDDILLSQPSSSLLVDCRMRERNFGTAQGQPLANLRKMAEDAGKSPAEYTPPEAETLEEMRMRAINFFNFICIRMSQAVCQEKPIILVGHGGWLRELVGYLVANSNDEEISSATRSKLGRICPNTGMTSFEIQLSKEGIPEQIRCINLHDKSHLDDLTENHYHQEMAL